jgi:release factor glutamine methyltransferase
MDVRSALKNGIAQLRSAQVPSYTLAAELLLLSVLRRDRTYLYAHPEEDLTGPQIEQFIALLARRAAGEPTQHLTGQQEFWGLDFEVTPEVLIPRPETEHVIEVALDRLGVRELRADRPAKNDGAGLQVADIGTGSGCIAIALAKELPAANFVATDISPNALVVAGRNAVRHGVDGRIQFIEANVLQRSGEQNHPVLFDVIVSNPPYIGRNEAETLPIEVRDHEPATALFGGEEGYELYADLIAQSAAHLKTGGILVLELGHNSLAAVQPLLDSSPWVSVGVTNDLAGVPRVVAAEKTGSG